MTKKAVKGTFHMLVGEDDCTTLKGLTVSLKRNNVNKACDQASVHVESTRENGTHYAHDEYLHAYPYM